MLKSWLQQRFGRAKPFGPVAPESPFYAIGDVHGRLDLMQRLLGQLGPELPVVCAGDYVDRGEESAEVLHFLRDHSGFVCLRGNHETMMLDFLDAPDSYGMHWLRNGGLQTLASFGIAGVSEHSDGADLARARDALQAAMGDELIDWLRNLPLVWQSGNVAVVHAGADPSEDISNQREQVLLWGHPEFARKPRRDGVWVVHGHTIVDAPSAKDGRISIDTGAFATGRLTAARIARDGVRFITT